MTKASQARYNARERERAREAGQTIRGFRAAARKSGAIVPKPAPVPLPLAVQRAVVNMRSAGIPKKGIYRELRKVLQHPPTHRQLEAVYKRYGSKYLGGVHGQRRVFKSATGRSVPGPKGGSTYRKRLPAEMRFLHSAEGLQHNYVLSYLRASTVEMTDTQLERTFRPAMYDWVTDREDGTP